MKPTLLCLASGFTWLLVAVTAPAHHAFTEFDQTRTTEIEGKLLEVRWQNPHVHFRVQATAASNAPAVWSIEGHSLSILRRTTATPERLRVGSTVRMAGWSSKSSPTRMFATHVLTEDRQEIVLQLGAKPRWEKVAAGLESTWFEGGGTANAELGLFRV
jgi:hypothetical protein